MPKRVVLDINKRKEYLRLWRKRSRKYIMYCTTKCRAKNRGIHFNLKVIDIPETPTHCPILGIPLKVHEGVSGWHDDSPSLDRIYPSKGYIKDNVRIISCRANRLKADATSEELEKLILDARCFGY